jgi:2,3-dihydroxybiphenyl 1,2-dioxygenase
MAFKGIAGLAYVSVDVTDLEAWAAFGTEVLGVQVVRADGELVYRMDERLARWVIRQGDADAVRSLAWEVTGRDRWETVLESIEKSGTTIEVLDAEQATARGVDRVATCTDPSGNALEIVLAPFIEPVRHFVSPNGTRFVTDDQGMGHVTIFVSNYDDTVRFYTDALGFQVRDIIASGIRATFASCNPRHHTVALIDGGSRAFVDHVMVEVEDIDMVGRALDRVVAESPGGAGLSQGLGRHWNDHMISFYVQSPSGFQVEYGCGARRVDPETWVEVRQGGVGGASIWGHQPTELAPHYGPEA